MAVEDFELEIGTAAESGYPVRVLQSPAGEARESMSFPFDEPQIVTAVQGVENQMLRARSRSRRMPSARDRAAELFGTQLFEALFAGSIQLRWEMSQHMARNRGHGLRLKLRIDDPVLASVPWEFLYDRHRGEHLCLSRNTPVVRFMHLRDPRRRLRVALPLRVLGVISSPSDLPALDIERERALLDSAIAPLADEGLVQVEWLATGSWRELHRTLLRDEWHVLHFVGHGGFDEGLDEGFVAFVGRNDEARMVDATRLGRLLSDHATLRLVVLNSCEGARGGGRDVFSSTSSILVRRGIPAVIAMQFEIEDQAAIEFAESFYGFLGSGLAVDSAVTEARKTVSLGRPGLEWAIPALHMHTVDGRLFDLDRSSAAAEDTEHRERTGSSGTTPPARKEAVTGNGPDAGRHEQPLDMSPTPTADFAAGMAGDDRKANDGPDQAASEPPPGEHPNVDEFPSAGAGAIPPVAGAEQADDPGDQDAFPPDGPAAGGPGILALIDEALDLHDRGRLEEAVAAYGEFVGQFAGEDDPAVQDQIALALVNQGVACEQLGHFDDGLAAYRQVTERFGGDAHPNILGHLAWALTNQGGALMELDRPNEAVVAYRQVVKRFFDDPDPDIREAVAIALVNQGLALEQVGHLDHAMEAYREVVDRFDSDSERREQVAKARFLRGRLQAVWPVRQSPEGMPPSGGPLRRQPRFRDPRSGH